MNLPLFRKHKIAPRHVTRLIPVSRLTASNWLNGHVKPSRFLEDQVESLERAIVTAEKYGEFPVPKAFLARARDAYVLTILRKYMEGMGKELTREE